MINKADPLFNHTLLNSTQGKSNFFQNNCIEFSDDVYVEWRNELLEVLKDVEMYPLLMPVGMVELACKTTNG